MLNVKKKKRQDFPCVGEQVKAYIQFMPERPEKTRTGGLGKRTGASNRRSGKKKTLSNRGKKKKTPSVTSKRGSGVGGGGAPTIDFEPKKPKRKQRRKEWHRGEDKSGQTQNIDNWKIGGDGKRLNSQGEKSSHGGPNWRSLGGHLGGQGKTICAGKTWGGPGGTKVNKQVRSGGLGGWREC